MAKLPAFAKAFAGRWRIAMEVGDNDVLDAVEQAQITSTARRTARSPAADFVCERA